MKNKAIKLLSIYFITILATTKVHALTSKELEELIECKASYQEYIGLGFEYEDKLKKLGWKKVSSDNLYIYRNKTTSLNVFGYKTHEIAFSGPAIFAVYRDVDVKKLAQEFDIPKIKELSDLSFFRGVKNIYREQGTDEHFGYAINLNLSEMIGKDSFVLLGCSYEIDQKDINSFLDE